jgi:hypothetical protein
MQHTGLITGQSTLNQTMKKLKCKTKASISTEKHKVSS